MLSNPAYDTEGRVREGALVCGNCSAFYPVIRYIPRFVDSENYARNFGFEWNTHSRTQFDAQLGYPLSRERFFRATQWPEKLPNEVILEVGCGAGRFTEQALSTGAMVVSIDYSEAVEANYANNGRAQNLLIVQADAFKLPFPAAGFDRLFCFGMIQHTPNPKKCFQTLVSHVKPGGNIVCDVYAHKWSAFLTPRKWLRAVTKHMPPPLLYALCSQWVSMLWPIIRYTRKLPGGRMFNRLVLMVADYGGLIPVSDEKLKELAILDTFDGFSAFYEKRQTLRSFRSWFVQAGLQDIDVRPGFNGYIGRGRRP